MTDDRPRAVLVLPGRGAYTATTLGTIPAGHDLVQRAEAIRAELGLDSLLALDAADTFEPSVHLRPANASPLIFLASLLDAERAVVDHRVVAVIGNSLGWSTALAVGGALAFEDAFRLVQGISLLQEAATEAGVDGGQLIYPRVGVDWQPVDEYTDAVEAALANGGDPADGRTDDGETDDGQTGDGTIYPSVDLGAYVVLAASDAGITRLLETLPPVKVGDRQFPLRLAFHGPYHTPLLASVAEGATEQFASLRWQRPEVTLIDGRGVRFTPWATDPAELARYTLSEQIVTPYRFAASARVAVREYAPDVLVLAGPGNTLGGVVGQLVVAEGYHGLRTRNDFDAAQGGGAPLVLSMAR
jgi:malonyl CoA-acyl carrier protein transacylase